MMTKRETIVALLRIRAKEPNADFMLLNAAADMLEEKPTWCQKFCNLFSKKAV